MSVELKDENQQLNESARLNLVVLAADVLQQYSERFVFDYSTMKVAERVPLDYDHNDNEIIGYAENFSFADSGVKAEALLLSAEDSPSAVAKEVAYNLRAGVPYEVSPLIDMDGATTLHLEYGETATVNGREIVGPVAIHSGAVIRGVAVCPHGTDPATSAYIAFKSHLSNSKEQNKMNPDDENDKTPTGKPREIPEELKALLDEFGSERGLNFYLSGYTLEEARAEDYEELKKLRDEKDAHAPDSAASDASASAQDDRKKNAQVEELSAKLAGVEKRLVALAAVVRRGDADGVTDSPADDKSRVPSNPLMAAAQKFSRMGSVRLHN